MKINLLSSIIIMSISLSVKAQNTIFNNVSIGTDAPANGVQIKANFPGVTAGWTRGFHITNEDGTQNFIGLGAFGGVANGISSLKNAYIGKDWDSQYMTFLANGNVGIGTTSPNSRLDLGKGYGKHGAKFLLYNDDDTNELSGTKCGFYMDNFTSNNLNLVFPEAVSHPGLFTISAKNTSETKLKPYFSIAGLTGNVGIGTSNPDEKLTVNGKIHAQEVRIDLQSPMTVPDYVFANDYKLKSLQEVEKFIKQNSHLPEIPSAKEIEKNGLMLAEMNMSLLKKIEELTLYSIAQEKKINTQTQEIETLKDLALRVTKIENELIQAKN